MIKFFILPVVSSQSIASVGYSSMRLARTTGFISDGINKTRGLLRENLIKNICWSKWSSLHLILILGVTKRYSATCSIKTTEQVVSIRRRSLLTTMAYLSSLLFGQSQQAGLLNSDILRITYDQSSSRLLIKSKAA